MAVNRKLKKETADWLYKHLGMSVWFVPKDLTKTANPSGNPPDVNRAQAVAFFDFLEGRKLILSVVNEHKEHVFLLNDLKEREWKELVRSFSLWHIFIWTNLKRLVARTGGVLFWMLTVTAGAALGAFAKEGVQEIVSYIRQNDNRPHIEAGRDQSGVEKNAAKKTSD